MQSQPIANLGMVLASCWTKSEIKSKWINHYALEQRRLVVSELGIPSNVAAFYVGLKKAGKIPPWVEMMTDNEAMDLLAS